MELVSDNLHIVQANSESQIRAAQRLRYKVFVEEMGATPSAQDANDRLERDSFDPFFDHLCLIDQSIEDPMENVVAVYRVMRGDVALANDGFYSATEYDLAPLIASNRRLLELGRSCVHADYRGGIALHLMWNGLADYVLAHEIEVLFGTASFHGTDVQAFGDSLSLLHHRHLAPEDIRASVLPAHGADMNIKREDQIDKAKAVRDLPPLIKAYLRLGGYVGLGAHIDQAFNTIDVCLLMDTQRMSQKHRAIYTKDQTA